MEKIVRRYKLDFTVEVNIPETAGQDETELVCEKSGDEKAMLGFFTSILLSEFCSPEELKDIVLKIEKG